jgi:hypothetical protein
MKKFNKDYSQNNIWVAKDKSVVYNIVNRESIKEPNDSVKTLKPQGANDFVAKGAKVEGKIFYYLPKNNKGKIVAKPTRLLRVAIAGTLTNKYYLASDFEPEVSISSFTGLDDLRNSMDSYGVDSSNELLNMESMDESITNMMGNASSSFDGVSGLAKAKVKTGRFINAGGYFKRNGFYVPGTKKSVVAVKSVPFYCVRTKTKSQRNLLIFDDGTAGAPNKWDNLNASYSNLVNESLLDGLTENTSLLEFEGNYSNLTNESLLDGLTENTSLLEFEGNYSNLTNESLLDGLTENTSLLEFSGKRYIDADGEYSNAIGDWFKGLFSGTKKLNAMPALADPSVFVVSAEAMQQAYEESGSSKKYEEWINSESGKAIAQAVAQFANILVNKPTSDIPSGETQTNETPTGGGDNKNDDKPKSETKIFGMTPVTFGLVAVGVIIIGSIVTYKIIKSKK